MRVSVCRISLFLAVVLAVPSIATAQSAGATASGKTSQATPKTADGKPDFTGYWGRLPSEDAQEGGGSADIQFNDGSGVLNGTVEGFQRWLSHFEKDGQVTGRAMSNRPIYKPEYWEKIRAADWNHSRKKDPSGHCLPSIPRLGPPQRIVQLPNEIMFFYEGAFTGGETLNRFRLIPTDGRPHDPVKISIPSWFGDSIGHWEGDTLVIETVGIIDSAWIGPNAATHSDEVKVIERMRRDGNTLHIDKTIIDPVMLMQPWQLEPVSVKLNTNPKAALWEEAPCDERDKEFEGDPFEGH